MSTCETERLTGSPVRRGVVRHKRVDEIVLHLHAHDTRFHNTPLVQRSRSSPNGSPLIRLERFVKYVCHRHWQNRILCRSMGL